MTPEMHTWITLGVTIAIFILGLVLVPMLKNLVNQRFGEFEEKFHDLETTAHSGIIDAVHDLKGNFHDHNTDAFAHPNLSIFGELKAHLKEVKDEIQEMRLSVEARLTAARKVATARDVKRRKA